MNDKTESDIPGLFRQFSGNSANYQELTRAAAARASQARWPLLSSVELEQGSIPAVVDAQTGEVAAPVARPAWPDAQPSPAEAAEPEQVPVLLPGNTIFMPPAVHTARHFAQIERRLSLRREAALSEIVMQPAEPEPEHALEALVAAVAPPVLTEVLATAPVRPAPAPAPASVAAATPTAATAPTAPKHAGLQPLFARLAGDGEDTQSVGSLFSRLMQS